MMSSPGMLDKDQRADTGREEISGPADARRGPGRERRSERQGGTDWAIATLHETFGLTLIRDIRIDSRARRLRCHEDADGALGNPHSLLMEPADIRRLVGLAGPGRACIETWLPIGDGGRFMLCLDDWQGGLAWRRGLITALPQAQESIDARRRHSRLADMGMQMAMMAHELRQPLFAIAMAAENLRRMLDAAGEGAGRLRLSAHRIGEQVGRAHDLIERTLRHARGDAGEASQADAVQAARAAVDAVKPRAEEAGVSIRLDAHVRRGPVPLSGLEIEQVFINILRNAVDSILARQADGWPGEGLVEISIHASQDRLVCVVDDNGLGIDEHVREKAGDPFFTTKAGTGTGLGLYICRQILANAGGGLEIGPRQGDGAREGARVEFTMRLLEAGALTLPRGPDG